jgi:predicted amidophosphoribosyltransferase
LAERGYNQSALIARAAARAGAWRVETDVLFRRKSTAPQALQDADTRKTNVADAFEVARTPGTPIVLVDDVATTGSTLAECILCLQRAGVIVRSVMTVALAGKAEGHHGCVF